MRKRCVSCMSYMRRRKAFWVFLSWSVKPFALPFVTTSVQKIMTFSFQQQRYSSNYLPFSHKLWQYFSHSFCTLFIVSCLKPLRNVCSLVQPMCLHTFSMLVKASWTMVLMLQSCPVLLREYVNFLLVVTFTYHLYHSPSNFRLAGRQHVSYNCVSHVLISGSLLMISLVFLFSVSSSTHCSSR